MLPFKSVFKYLRTSTRLEIYTDGSSKDGFGSWAYLIARNGKCITENAGRVRRGNSNAMELQAAIEALLSLPANSKATLFSDSRILIDAMQVGKGPLAYQAQFDVLMRLNQIYKIEWLWVKAHAGNRFNERCDELCTEAIQIPRKSTLS